MNNTTILMPIKVDPIGFPKDRKWRCVPVEGSPSGSEGSSFAREVLRRKSWVTAIPMEANAREVRSQARNVRSRVKVSVSFTAAGTCREQCT